MVESFVAGWDFIQTLGEGAYGEVKLAVNRETEEAVAVKMIDLEKAGKMGLDQVKKEALIHRNLNHANIIKFYGQRHENNVQYMFLEYASGGELFDRIEPDIGMPQAQAHRYFKDLMSAVEYLHQHGVAHRDLKPENLLLDENDSLKVTDFGLATVFRHQGKSRRLDRCCGTVPYVAPEVISKQPYNAEPADLWSCGIILVAMIAGELPWDEPSYACKEYGNWKDCNITSSPWNKIDNLVFSLLRKILTESVAKRYNVSKIKTHQWFTKTFTKKCIRSTNGSPLDLNQNTPSFKRMCSGRDISPGNTKSNHQPQSFSLSQPEARRSDTPTSTGTPGTPSDDHFIHNNVSFSQPVHFDDMLLSTQFFSTQGASQTPFQRFVKRMTRFKVRTDAKQTTKQLKSVCDKLGYSWKTNGPGQITISTKDRRKSDLVIKLSLIEMGPEILLDFRLSKGDGIEFKRNFIKIKDQLSGIVAKSSYFPSTTKAANTKSTSEETVS